MSFSEHFQSYSVILFLKMRDNALSIFVFAAVQSNGVQSHDFTFG